jgi:hypothetical protein
MIVGCSRGLLFEPEDGGGTFLQHVGELLSFYTESHPTRITVREPQSNVIYSYLLHPEVPVVYSHFVTVRWKNI